MKKLMIVAVLISSSTMLFASELETLKSGSELNAISMESLQQINVNEIPVSESVPVYNEQDSQIPNPGLIGKDAFTGLEQCNIVDAKFETQTTLSNAIKIMEPCLEAVGRKYHMGVSAAIGLVNRPPLGYPQWNGSASGIWILVSGKLPFGNSVIVDLEKAVDVRNGYILGHPAKVEYWGEELLNSQSGEVQPTQRSQSPFDKARPSVEIAVFDVEYLNCLNNWHLDIVLAVRTSQGDFRKTFSAPCDSPFSANFSEDGFSCRLESPMCTHSYGQRENVYVRCTGEGSHTVVSDSEYFLCPNK